LADALVHQLAIIDAGGHARDALQIVRVLDRAASCWHCLGVVVDPSYPAPVSLPKAGSAPRHSPGGVPLRSSLRSPIRGGGRDRRAARQVPNVLFPTLIDPRAVIGELWSWCGHRRDLLGETAVITEIGCEPISHTQRRLQTAGLGLA
jgi:hypothetical protein